MLPVTIQHPDGVVYHFYNADDSCSRKGSRLIFSKIDESRASRFLSLFTFEDLSKIYKLLPKKDLERAFPKKHIIKALTAGTLLAYEERADNDASETEMALLRLEIKMTLNQILSVEIAEAANIEKSLENKNVVQKILLYKKEYDKGFIDAGVEFLTWIKDVYEVVSPTENLKRAIDAGWETYKSDSPEWKQTFADKLKASNYKEVIDALGFDPGRLSTEQIVEVFESAQLIYDDEKTQEIILKFIRDYAGAQHSLEWANFIGSAAFDIVLTALLAFATGGVGAAASVGSKAGRLMKPLAKLGEKFSELAKKLSKKFKPKKRKKTKVGGGKKDKSSNKSKNDENDTASNDTDESPPGKPNSGPGSDEHRAQRWKEYKERGGEWDKDRWDKQYDVNMQQANKSHKAVAGYRDRNGLTDDKGWATEKTLKDGEGTERRLDIVNEDTQQAIEHKKGQQYLTKDNLSEIERDAKLRENTDWEIEWHFDDHASKPLTDKLDEVGIPWTIGD